MPRPAPAAAAMESPPRQCGVELRREVSGGPRLQRELHGHGGGQAGQDQARSQAGEDALAADHGRLAGARNEKTHPPPGQHGRELRRPHQIGNALSAAVFEGQTALALLHRQAEKFTVGSHTSRGLASAANCRRRGSGRENHRDRQSG